MSERRWTTRELRRAQRQGAVIRAWGKDSVRWDPRGPGDRQPWESYDVRFSARECRPENPDGSPWTGPQNDDHGSEEPAMDRKPEALESAAVKLRESVDRILAQGVPLEDIRELADAARVYGAEHALAKLMKARMSSTSPVYLSGASTAKHVKSVPLPLTDVAE